MTAPAPLDAHRATIDAHQYSSNPHGTDSAGMVDVARRDHTTRSHVLRHVSARIVTRAQHIDAHECDISISNVSLRKIKAAARRELKLGTSAQLGAYQ